MKLELQLRSLGTQNVNGIPIINNREYNGQITVKDGESSVVTGLIDMNDSRSINGYPFLGQVPGLNYGTSVHNKNVTEDELLVVITPAHPAPGRSDALRHGTAAVPLKSAVHNCEYRYATEVVQSRFSSHRLSLTGSCKSSDARFVSLAMNLFTALARRLASSVRCWHLLPRPLRAIRYPPAKLSGCGSPRLFPPTRAKPGDMVTGVLTEAITVRKRNRISRRHARHRHGALGAQSGMGYSPRDRRRSNSISINCIQTTGRQSNSWLRSAKWRTPASRFRRRE